MISLSLKITQLGEKFFIMIHQFYTLNIIGMKKNVITLLALFVFTITQAQNVGIGTTSPNASAQLEVRATNKGLLIPRVNLTSTTDVTTIASPVISLLVFNTNTAITGGSGFYAWGGTAWIKLALTTDITSSAWGFSGNTITSFNYLGTNNQQPIRFKLNGNNAGFMGQRKIYLGEGAGENDLSNYSSTNANIGIGNGTLAKIDPFDDIYNIAIGDSALHKNIESVFGNASRNIAVGHHALKNGVGLFNNIAIGYLSQNESSGSSSNISLGNYSMQNFQGGNSIAIGNNALGNDGLPPTTNSQCIAIGTSAMRYAAAGSFSIGIGQFNLLGNVGNYNTSIGNRTMKNNIAGEKNAAYGDSALHANLDGNNNVAMGFEAGKSNTNGNLNCFIGANSGIGNTVGDRNIAIGRQTYTQTPSSIGNIIIGSNAADTFDLGSNNTLIGAFTDVNANGYTQSTGLGYNAYVTASNQVKIGATTTTSIGGFQNWTNFSDGRFKQNVKPNVPGLDFILKLKPVTYNLDIEGIDKMLGKFANEEDDIKQNLANVQHAKSIIYTGFVAQEVETAAQKLGFQFSGVDAPKNEKDFYGLRYAEFVVPLVKAVQEQQQKIEKVESENADLKNKLTDLMQRIEVLEKSK
jgi:trimeric autotransporter adhesin